MVRVRDEQEFLAVSVRSIAPFVDEVVILDNRSTDATPEVIRELACDLPAVRTAAYPFDLPRVGSENLAAASAGGRSTPHRLSSYYNWALRQCRYAFVLKWDGDMVAADEFRAFWERWRSGPYLSMSFKGGNVHPDRAHLLGARSGDPTVVGRGLAGDFVPDWVLETTYTSREPRLFPRFLTRYDDGLWWCERLSSPLATGLFAPRHRLEPEAPL